jgi:hypothetical protein
VTKAHEATNKRLIEAVAHLGTPIMKDDGIITDRGASARMRRGTF